MSAPLLRRMEPSEIGVRRGAAVDDETLAAADAIVRDVADRGEEALREYAGKLDGLDPAAPLIIGRLELERAIDSIDREERAVLERTAERIRAFAEVQRQAIGDVRLEIPGGLASHRVTPLDTAGCYAPSGRHPLPSSLLMTAVTARVVGVPEVWVASPRPDAVTRAAAAVAEIDGLLVCGGAQAIAALAFGTGGVPVCDVIVGPGNKWVTAAKKIVSGRVRIDMLAGPSELVVLADDSADPATVAADLLAQAEHDDDAVPVIVALDESLVGEVERALARQLDGLPTEATARRALRNGYAVVVSDIAEAIAVCDRIAPEHLQLSVSGAPSVASRLKHYGGLFIGEGAAEVFGDYGAGPNHVLPTGGTARYTGGLSVLDFLKVHTQLEVTDEPAFGPTARDVVRLARMEGLEAHARAAEHRCPPRQ